MATMWERAGVNTGAFPVRVTWCARADSRIPRPPPLEKPHWKSVDNKVDPATNSHDTLVLESGSVRPGPHDA
ncbi:hypothetical protein GCM10027590_37650 [Nocardiopsis nanhaiensis]